MYSMIINFTSVIDVNQILIPLVSSNNIILDPKFGLWTNQNFLDLR